MTKSSPQKPVNFAEILMLFVAISSGVLGHFIRHELWFSISGKKTDAKVTRQSTESRGTRSNSYSVVVVDYSFTEASGRHRNERDEKRFHSGLMLGDTLAVEYISRVGGLSRIEGHTASLSGALVVGAMFLMPFLVLSWFLFWPRLVGRFFFSFGSFILSVMLAVGFSSTLLCDGTRSGDWIGILTAPVPLISGVVGFGGLWFSSRGLWRLLSPRSDESDPRTDPEAPLFSADSLVCQSNTGYGKPKAVIVDHSAGVIHFQNCHRPHGFWVIRSHAWLSCPLADVRWIRRKTTKTKGVISKIYEIETRTGSVNLGYSGITNLDALRRCFAETRTP